MNKGWVKIHRSLLDWQWYDDDKALRLLLHLILTVNFEDKKWHGILIEAGSMVLSWDTLSSSTKMSKQQCRTAMTKLETCGEVTRKTTNKYQIVTLVKWEQMQIEEIKTTDRLTDKQQTNNRQITPTKECKEIKNDKKYINNSEFSKNLISNQQWIETICMQQKIKLEEVENYLNRFEQHLITSQNQHNNQKDFSAHFTNWLGIQKEKNTPKKEKEDAATILQRKYGLI